MSRLRHVRSLAALLKGADHLLVLAPEAAFRAKRHPGLDALPEDLARLCRDLASDLSAGLEGNAAGTLTSSSPRKLAVGVLPDTVSRHNTPSRAEAVRKCMVQSNTGRKGKGAVLLLLDDPDHQLAASLAVARSLPLLDLRSAKSPAASCALLALGPKGEPLKASRAVEAGCTYAREAARLVDSPPTDMNPGAMQKEAYALLRGVKGVARKALVGPALLEAGCGGIHAVGRTAKVAPRMVVLTWAPKGAKQHVALVGKGVTYDTGGLSLKPTTGMCNMKTDMGGSAAVLGAFCSLVRSGVKHKVSAVLCLAENAIGPDAFKNDDVLTMHSGKTVEVNNTDAEGRLLLADGVSYAARKLKADVVVDIATLTGAQLVATGKGHAAVVSSEEDLEQALVAAGKRSGELVHPLPFAPEFHRKEFASTVADMKNSVADRMNAQSSCASEFVRWHLDGTDVRWAHVDMAGPASLAGRATGFGAGLLAEFVRGL